MFYRVKSGAQVDLLTSRMTGLINRYSDVAVAVIVVGIVAMLVIPLPTFLVDILLVVNIACAVTLLLISTYVTNVLRFSTFPTILLIATLFRLALNVSTTRLILLQADAGNVVDSFGEFVVRGDYIVGAVVFLILTIVQFVVIARGSGRVAEVAARFTLDAMPGKQLAIDGDLRAGAIDQKTASRRRRELEQESQLYGAMDGAMKFVKGDAIAGFVITLINILGGLAIGIFKRGMEVGDAAEVFGLLTIGDGLVSQIPAILVATASGVLVTRVTTDGGQTHLGRDIASQIVRHPKAIAITSGLLLLFAILPGLPVIPFFLLALMTAYLAHSLYRKQRKMPQPSSPGTEPFAQESWPLKVHLTAALADSLERTGGSERLRIALDQVCQAIRSTSGVAVPPIHFLVSQHLKRQSAYVIELEGMPLGEGRVDPGVDIPEIIATSFNNAIVSNLEELIGIQNVQGLVDDLADTHPALVKAVVPRVVTLNRLCEILRALVREKISIRNLRKILDALAEPPVMHQPLNDAVEWVRHNLKREISHQFASETGEISVYLFDPRIEQMVRSSVNENELVLEPDIVEEVSAAIFEATTDTTQDNESPILLTSSDIRPHLFDLARISVPNVVVLSHDDLLPTISVRALGTIAVGRPGAES